jgi:acetate CoA/acetoacetate CoA-transferase alpha subunit
VIDRTRELEEAVREYVRSGMTLMIGGFGRGGTPFSLLDHLADHEDDFRDLTLVKNDANEPDLGVGVLLARGMVRRMISTHIGLNPDFIAQMNGGQVETELVPQGIFAERIRAGGAGIPAFLTDVGMGTVVAEGKRAVELHGKSWLLEEALRGDVALLCADVVDRSGNCRWRGSNNNMNQVMGTACDRVIVEARSIVPVGDLQPEDVHLPSVFVDAVVQAGPRRHVRPGGEDG